MRKVLLGATAMMAAVAGFIFMPKVSAQGVTARLSSSGQTSIPIHRTITNLTGAANVKVSYKLEAKEGNPASVGGLQSTTNLLFTGQANSNNELKGNCNLQLGNMSFSKVGDYTFTLYESAVSDTNGYALDAENKYDIYFQVTNVLDDNGQPTGELRAELVNQMYSYKDDAKVPLSANFSAPAIRSYVTLTSQVKGAAADADKYFKYKVHLEGVNDGTNLAIVGQDATVDYAGEQIPTTATAAPTDGVVELDVYLKHGQTVTVGELSSDRSSFGQLPIGVSYSIQKVETDDGYVTTVDDAEGTEVAKNVALIGSENFVASNTTTIVNSKDATVNTGVFAVAWPFLIVAACGLGGFVIVRRLTRKV